jgi:hypothetical protein
MGCGGSSKQLTEQSLKKEVETVQGLAAEAALLADGAAQGRTLGTFTRMHAEDLATPAKTSARSLRTARAPHALEPKRRAAAFLAARVYSSLTQLQRGVPRERARLIARSLHASEQKLAELAQ